MASVPSAGCLLARNQYYRKASVSSGTSLTGPDSVSFVGDDKAQLGLPEVAESTWWFKSFFQSVPVLSNVKREDQSACGQILGGLLHVAMLKLAFPVLLLLSCFSHVRLCATP
ncbi:pancreatic progenitor cell differentiation and proliferation factor-like protein isoform X1 [Muntiacus reevesi]|uniref:pancreatic progenitor cell differentiation and proliferation factor-like protein isoform X1 n=1 Tax=Muntiacus reevesi TaxID=9886 RepID=UPI003307C1DD